MKEVTGPVIATTLVLLAVFVPTAAMAGITGTMFKQLAITISIATCFSSINALTLSPALCGILLKPGQAEARGIFKLFNNSVLASNKLYQSLVRIALKGAVIGVVVFVAMLYFAGKGMGSLPTGFVPQEDEGYCMVGVQLPDGATLERTNAVMERVQRIVSATPGIADCLSIAGFSLLDGAAGVNAGFCVAVFDHWDERGTAELHQNGILAALQRQFYQIQDAIVFAFPMPSLPGVGTTGGFTYMLQDLQGGGLEQLAAAANGLIAEANRDPSTAGVRTTFRASVPADLCRPRPRANQTYRHLAHRGV